MLPDTFTHAIAHLDKGGLVMQPILVISVWMWILIFLKLGQFYGQRKGCPVKTCIRERGGPAAPWQLGIAGPFLSCGNCRSELDRPLVESLLKRQETLLFRHIHTILILAAVAPLLGLLGTVTGMIGTFEVIARFGTGNAKALASGISEALITTQSGLMVAIPGIFMGRFLQRRAENLQGRMQRFCLGLLDSENWRKTE